MLILTVRTDKPEAELGLFEDDKQLAYETWQAHRQLAETLHRKIQELLANQNKALADIQGLVGYEGPGSFTGLRIGLSVVNALAASYAVPAVGASGEDWLQKGIAKLLAGEIVMAVVLPEYGGPAFTTPPRK